MVVASVLRVLRFKMSLRALSGMAWRMPVRIRSAVPQPPLTARHARRPPPQEKLRVKEEKDKAEAKFKTAYVDGRAEQVGNFRVEPPGLFR